MEDLENMFKDLLENAIVVGPDGERLSKEESEIMLKDMLTGAKTTPHAEEDYHPLFLEATETLTLEESTIEKRIKKFQEITGLSSTHFSALSEAYNMVFGAKDIYNMNLLEMQEHASKEMDLALLLTLFGFLLGQASLDKSTEDVLG